MPNCRTVVLGGFLSGSGLCDVLRSSLQEVTGGSVAVVPVSLAEWVAAISAAGWLRILRKLDSTVRAAVDLNGGGRVKLVGWSSGGVIGRLYLSPEPFKGESFNGLTRVSHLVTLGSPHRNVRGARMRRWVDQILPGAYFAPEVVYKSVAGSMIRGDLRGSLRQKMVYPVYRHLGGEGSVWGDGLVPVTCALLDGAEHLTLSNVGHAPIGGRPWYGTPEVVRTWWTY